VLSARRRDRPPPKDGDPRALATFFPGLLFGWMRSSTKSILAGTLTHASSNILVASSTWSCSDDRHDAIAALFDMDAVLRVDTAMSWDPVPARAGELSDRDGRQGDLLELALQARLLDMEACSPKLCPISRATPRPRWSRRPRSGFAITSSPRSRSPRGSRIAHHQQLGHTSCSRPLDGLRRAPGRPRGRHRPRARDRARGRSDGDAFTGRPSALASAPQGCARERWAAAHGVDLARSYFYSDSYNDLPMLARVGTAIAVNRMRGSRARRGAAPWPVQPLALDLVRRFRSLDRCAICIGWASIDDCS